MTNLMRRLFRRYLITIVACVTVLSGFQLLMCAIVATIDISAALQQLLTFAPPIFQGMSQTLLLGGNTNAALIAFGWNHPITHALAMVLPITLASRTIAGEIETGSIELILAQPISRARYLATHMAFALLAIAVLAAFGAAATGLGQISLSIDSFPRTRLLTLALSFWLLQSAVFAVTLAFSAYGREAGRVAFAGILVALVSYLFEAVATLWPRAVWLGPYSLHHYFHPRALLVEGKFAAATVVVLFSVFLIASMIAFARFQRRDLP